MGVNIVTMKRYLEKFIKKDLKNKIVFLTGPRQVGKTTLSKMITDDYDYFNYDNAEDRLGILDMSWDRTKKLIIFDELHKLKNWKSWLKGIYDKEGIPPWLLGTGSAKLDTFRKVGDSLAGRFFQFRLHPLDLKEIRSQQEKTDLQDDLEKLLNIGGFPEPFLKGNHRFYNRWKRSHLDIILKQDLIELENVQEINSIETLIQLLRRRVGSPVSYSSLARDLQCSDKTVKRWLTILENMYVLFRVPPFHRNIARSILKSPKYYFYDTGQVLGDDGAKLENLVACALQKEIHFRIDCYGEEKGLYYIRTKEGTELDFCITLEDHPFMLLEVKWGSQSPSSAFKKIHKFFPESSQLQIVKELDRTRTYPDGVEIRSAHDWLSSFVL